MIYTRRDTKRSYTTHEMPKDSIDVFRYALGFTVPRPMPTGSSTNTKAASDWLDQYY